eukprot:1815409-Amphidinium_carterae.1
MHSMVDAVCRQTSIQFRSCLKGHGFESDSNRALALYIAAPDCALLRPKVTAVSAAVDVYRSCTLGCEFKRFALATRPSTLSEQEMAGGMGPRIISPSPSIGL